VYKLTVGQEQEMILTAVVYNSGEEAHQALLSVTLPPHLHYVGTGTRVCIKIGLLARESKPLLLFNKMERINVYIHCVSKKSIPPNHQ